MSIIFNSSFIFLLLVLVVSILNGCSSIQSHSALGASEVNGRGEEAISYKLPKNTLTATITLANSKHDLTLTKNTIADEGLRFDVSYDRNVFYEDKITLGTTSEGFLKTITNQTIDKTPEITEKIAKIFLTTIGKTPFTSNLRALTADKLEGSDTILKYEFDPFSYIELKQANLIMKRKSPYCIAVFSTDRQPLPGSCLPQNGRYRLIDGFETNNHVNVPVESFSGVFHRREQQHYIVVFKKSGHRWDVLMGTKERFFNASKIERIALGRGAFIDQTQTIAFSNGVLTQYQINKPSEMLGFLQIPSVIVNTLIQIPGLQTTALTNDAANLKKQLDARDNIIREREREVAIREREQSLRSLKQNTILDLPKKRTTSQEEIAARRSFHFQKCEDSGASKELCEDEWRKRENL